MSASENNLDPLGCELSTWPDLSTSQGTGMGNARGKNPADETASLNTLTFKKKKGKKRKKPFSGLPPAA